jgi:hypothetical protein
MFNGIQPVHGYSIAKKVSLKIRYYGQNRGFDAARIAKLPACENAEYQTIICNYSKSIALLSGFYHP